jgi:hypothetical protein
MSKTLLAVMAFLLLVGPFGLAGAAVCQASDFTQTIPVDDADPCPDNEQMIKTIKVHSCDCGSIMLPTEVLETAVSSLTQFSFELLLWPQTAVTELSTPPPRLI